MVDDPKWHSPDWVKNILFWILDIPDSHRINPKSPLDAVDADVETSMVARLPPDFSNLISGVFLEKTCFHWEKLKQRKKKNKRGDNLNYTVDP